MEDDKAVCFTDRNFQGSGGSGAAHNFCEGRLEGLHLLGRAYGDADVGWPDGPDAANVDVLRAHGGHDLAAGAAGVDHEAVGEGRDVFVALGVHPGEGGVAGVGDNFAAGGDEVGLLEAGGSSGEGGDGESVAAVEVELLEEVGAAEGDAAADAGHAVDLGEGAEDDDVLAEGDLIDYRRGAGNVDVGLVDEEDGAGGFVVECPKDVLLWCQRTGRIVGATDINDARIGIRSDHRTDIVGVGRGEGDLDDFDATGFGGDHAGLVAGIGGDIAAGGRGEREGGELEGLAGACVDGDVVGGKAELGGELGGKFVFGAGCIVASTGARDGGDGGESGVTGAKGILVGVDHDGVGVGGVREVAVYRFGGRGLLRCAGEMGF